ncbi:MAG: class I SAM-dependent RNA methyltransferase [Acidobacteriota bacterium]|nr:class I SAM-dependent RNA methyltransferase [Acidobacteriota bacterium]
MNPAVEDEGERSARTFEVEIERLLPGGVGLAHAEGLTLFVSLAAPGDVVQIKIDRVQGKLGYASIQEIVKPSAVRVEPPCPYFGLCGGCDFQQLTYEAQLNAKVEIIRDCLRRLAGIDVTGEIPMHASPDEWHYRARAMWQLDPVRGYLGYFARGSRDVCDVEYCAVLAPELEDTFEKLRKKLRAQGAPRELRNIEAVVGDERVSTSLQPTEVSRIIGNERYHFSAQAFFQINHALLPALTAEAIGEEKGKIAIDLYCGVGLFTLPLARRFQEVVAVETNERAAHFARRNLEFAELKNAEVVTLDVGEWLKYYRSFEPLDLLLLDPPRAGVENRVIEGILSVRPQQIVYVSCDPATLARDLKKLIAGGYSFHSVVAFDMFPQTHHVETVVRLLVT